MTFQIGCSDASYKTNKQIESARTISLSLVFQRVESKAALRKKRDCEMHAKAKKQDCETPKIQQQFCKTPGENSQPLSIYTIKIHCLYIIIQEFLI